MLRSIGVGVTTAALVAAGAVGADAKGPGGSNGGGGGTPPSVGETAGNNLSYPLLIAGETVDGTHYSGPALRGTEGSPVLGTLPSDYLVLPDGSRAYYQQNENNTWQASNEDTMCAAAIPVSWINWGDNLESKDWAYRQMVRVETQLYAPALEGMFGYEMAKTNDLTGQNEMWGLHTDSAAEPFTYVPGISEFGVPTNDGTGTPTAFVYTAAARLSIQKIDPETADDLKWIDGWWQGGDATLDDVVVDIDTATSPDGILGYKGEISVSGNFVYGFVWNTRTQSDGPGEYRLTYSLDGLPNLPSNCVSLEGAQIMDPAEEEAVAEAEPGGEPSGNVPGFDDAKTLTYIDVGLTTNKGGGGKNK